MNVTKHFLTSLRNTVLESLQPIPHEMFYSSPNKTDQASKSTKKSLKYIRQEFLLSPQEESQESAPVDEVEVDTQPAKKRKYETSSQKHAVAVEKSVQIITQGKKKLEASLKSTVVDDVQNAKVEKGKKPQSPSKSAAAVEQKRRGRKRKTALNSAVADDKQNAEVEDGEELKSPVKSAAAVDETVGQKHRGRKRIATVGQGQNAEVEKGKKPQSPSKSVAVDEANVGQKRRGRKRRIQLKIADAAGVGQNAEVEKGKKPQSPSKSAAVDEANVGQKRRGRKRRIQLEIADAADVGQNAEVEKGKKPQSPSKSAAVDEANVGQKRRGRKRRIQLEIADAADVGQNAEVEKGKKPQSPSKSAAVDEANVGQKRRGRKRRIQLEIADAADVGQNAEVEKGKKPQSPSKSAAVDEANVGQKRRGRKRRIQLEIADAADVGQNAEVEKGKKPQSPSKSAAVDEANVGQKRRGRKRRIQLKIADAADVGQNAEVEKGKKPQSPSKSAAVDEANIGQNAEDGKRKKTKSPLKNAAVVDDNNVGQNHHGRKKNITFKTEAVDTIDEGQNAEDGKGKKLKSLLKSPKVDENIGQNEQIVKQQGRKIRFALNATVVSPTGIVQRVQILIKRRRMKKSAAVDVERNADVKRKKSPIKPAAVNTTMTTRQNSRAKKEALPPKKQEQTGTPTARKSGKIGQRLIKMAVPYKRMKPRKCGPDMDTKIKIEIEDSHDMQNQKKIPTPSQKIPKMSKVPLDTVKSKHSRVVRKLSENSRAEKKFSPQEKQAQSRTPKSPPPPARKGAKIGQRLIKMAVPYKRMKPRKCGPDMDTKIKIEIEDPHDMQNQKKNPIPSQKMPKMSKVSLDTVKSKQARVVRKLSWGFGIPAKESLPKGYRPRKRMAKKIVASTRAPRLLRKEKSQADFIMNTLIKKEPKEEIAEEELEGQEPAGFEQNNTEPSEVDSAVGCSTKEMEFLSIPEDVELSDDEEHALIFQSHTQARYQLRKRRPKDPLKPKKYRFKKVPLEVKPEPLMDFEFEVTNEVDTLSLDEIVIPDSLPFEFGTQAVPVTSTSHHQEDIYKAVPMASSSHHEDIYKIVPVASTSHQEDIYKAVPVASSSNHEDIYKAVPVASTSHQEDMEMDGFAEASNLVDVKVILVKPENLKKTQPKRQVYNLREKKKQSLPETKQVKSVPLILDYDILNTRVVLRKKPHQNYWS